MYWARFAWSEDFKRSSSDVMIDNDYCMWITKFKHFPIKFSFGVVHCLVFVVLKLQTGSFGLLGYCRVGRGWMNNDWKSACPSKTEKVGELVIPPCQQKMKLRNFAISYRISGMNNVVKRFLHNYSFFDIPPKTPYSQWVLFQTRTLSLL